MEKKIARLRRAKSTRARIRELGMPRLSVLRSGQRVSTLVTYLADVPAGGQTVFPALGWAVSPLRGNAVYFEYGDDHGRVDARSLHASAPVTRGEKWVVTKWMRARRFVPAG